jgi:hypothetical protein
VDFEQVAYRKKIAVGDYVCGGHRMMEKRRGVVVQIGPIGKYLIRLDSGEVIELTRSEFRKSANRKRWTWL